MESALDYYASNGDGRNRNGNSHDHTETSIPFSPALDRIPPQELEAEQAVIGCILLDPTSSALDAARNCISSIDFYRDAHRRIFECCCSLESQGEPVDLLTVASELERTGQSELTGGRPYLIACQGAVPAVGRAGAYALRVREASLLRRVIDLCGNGIRLAYERDTPASELISALTTSLMELGQRGQAGGPRSVSDVLPEVYGEAAEAEASDSRIIGVSTGFEDLDSYTGGLQRGETIIIAARPSVGKTALALNLATNAASNGVGTLVFSLEMDERALGRRLLSADTSIDSLRIRNGRLSSTGRIDEWEQLTASVSRLSRLPIWIDETPSLNIAELRARARRLKHEHGIGLVVVDYLQLVSPGTVHGTRNEEVAWMSRQLKMLAGELKTPIIVLSQLSRNSERREGKIPCLSDLRDSGALEQDADCVFFLHRPDMAAGKREPGNGEAQGPEEALLMIEKQRNGPRGVTVPLLFVKRYGYFKPALRIGSAPAESSFVS